MKHLPLASAVALLALAAPAHAGGTQGSIGVGVESTLSGVGGVSMNYDAGKMLLGGFFSYQDAPGADNTTISIGGRFFFKIAETASSDFSIGGSLALDNFDVINNEGEAESVNEVFLEPSFQIRVFLGSANNVALSFTGGLSIGLNDADGVILDGQPTGVAGVHYYF
jgi:hypothetical protein